MAKVEKLAKKQAEVDRQASAAHSNVRAPLVAKRDALDTAIRQALGGSITLAFLKKHAVSPTGDGHTVTQNVVGIGGQAATVTKMDWENEAVSVTDNQVKFADYATGAKKVAWALLSKRPGEGNLFDIRITPAQPNVAGAFEVYYLPWKADMVLRVSLPAMGQGVGGHDPSIFFTAAINGCSIFIEGPPQTPTIYHGGTERVLGAAGSGYWRDLFREFSGNADAKGHKTFGEVKADQYVNLKAKAGRDDDLRWLLDFMPANVKTTREAIAFADWLRTQQKDLLVTDTTPYGCVFGFRDGNGDWTFYLQKNVQVTFYSFKRPYGPASKRKQGATEKKINMPMEVVQVFPGRAHVRMSGFSKIETALST